MSKALETRSSSTKRKAGGEIREDRSEEGNFENDAEISHQDHDDDPQDIEQNFTENFEPQTQPQPLEG